MALGDLKVNREVTDNTLNMQKLREQYEIEDTHKSVVKVRGNSGEEHPMRLSVYDVDNRKLANPVHLKVHNLKRMKLSSVNYVKRNR